MPDIIRKQFWPLLCSTGLLLVPAVLFSAVVDSPHMLYLAGLGLVLSIVIRQPVPRTTRSYVYAGVLVAVLTVFQEQIFTMEDERFFLLPAEFYCPALIFLGVVLTYFDSRQTTLSAISGAAIIATMLAGNTLGASEPNTKFTFGNLIMENLAPAYFIAAMLQAVFLILLLPSIMHFKRADSRKRKPAPGHKIAVYSTAIFFLVAGVISLRATALAAAPRLQSLLHGMMRDYFPYRTRGVMFDDKVDLHETIAFKKRNERTILLRAKTDTAPGYLRGRAYHEYQDGEWTGFEATTSLPYEPLKQKVIISRYKRPDWFLPDEPGTIDIYPSGHLRSDVLFAPGNTGQIEVIAEDLRSDPSGVLYTEEWDETGGYTLRLNKQIFSAAYPLPELEPDLRKTYSEVPDEISAELQHYAADLFRGQNASSMDHIRQLKQHFEANFAYKLGVKLEQSKDPVLDFLTNKRRGHCELFASATALLLRTQGIPTRYVTGFVCAEPHPNNKYWVSRLEDAHAWVEAYAPDEDRWVLVETTPATGIPQGQNRFGWFTSLTDRASLLWDRLIAYLKRGYPASVIMQALSAVYNGLVWVVLHPVRGPIAVVLAILAAFWLWLQHVQRQKPSAADLAPEILMLQAAGRQIEKYLAQYRLYRPPAQTIREFATEVRHSNVPRADAAAELLHEYEIMRYHLHPPNQHLVETFRQRVTRRLSEH